MKTSTVSCLFIADPPEIINLTQSVTAEIGKTVVLTCVADGFPSPEIQWEKNDITISNDSTVKCNHIIMMISTDMDVCILTGYHH